MLKDLGNPGKTVLLYMIIHNDKGFINETPEEISEALNISRSTSYRGVHELLEFDWIKETESGYMLNPRYAKVG